MERIVSPEILDQLAHDDPAAQRSRRDLSRLNTIMGNPVWLRRQIAKFAKEGEGGPAVIEIGAGDGRLAKALHNDGATVTALDLAPPPPSLPDGVLWAQGDMMETLPAANGDTLVACLVLHHFSTEELAVLGQCIQASNMTRILAVEPHRARFPLYACRMAFPFINHVTRHDMVVSIRAGFRPGELARLLGLAATHWRVRESIGLLGGYQFMAERIE